MAIPLSDPSFSNSLAEPVQDDSRWANEISCGEKVWNIWNTGRKAVPAKTQGYLKLVTLALAHIQRKWRGTIRN